MKKTNSLHQLMASRRVFAALSLLSAAVLSVVIAGCGKDRQAQTRGRRPPPNVYIQPIVYDDVMPKLTAVGSVTPRRTSIVASGANGVVQRYDVNEGDWIEQETVLSVLRVKSSDRELDEARAILAQRKAEFDQAKLAREEEAEIAKSQRNAAKVANEVAEKKYARAIEAFDRKAIPADELDDSKQRAKQALAEFQVADQKLKQLQKEGSRIQLVAKAEQQWKAQQEHVNFLEAEYEKRTTKAPFSGYVVKEHTYIGQWLSKGDPVATLARLDEVDIVVNVDQEDIRHVQVGKQADVAIDGFRLVAMTTTDGDSYKHALLESESVESVTLLLDNGQQRTMAKTGIATRQPLSWTGEVVQIVPKSEWQTGSRGFPVKVRVKNWFRHVPIPNWDRLYGMEIRKMPVLNEGMMATVTFTGEKTKAYLVHKDALVRSTRGMKINVFVPSEGEPKDKPKKGSTYQMGVSTGVGDGNLIQVTPRPTNKGEPADLKQFKFVVTEGGERLLPVQGEVTVSDPPSERNQPAGKTPAEK